MSNARQQVRVELLAEALRSTGTACLRVFGGSMMPWLRPGDTLFVRRETPQGITPGEIVLYARRGRLYAHRVIRKRWEAGKSLLVTKGDTLPDADPLVSSEELLGRVTRICRGQRQINLQTSPRLFLGRVLTYLSAWSRWWFPVVRAVKRLCFPGKVRLRSETCLE